MIRDFLKHSVLHLRSKALPSSAPKQAAPTAEAPKDTRPAAALKLREILAEDYATYNRNWAEPGFWAVAVHRLGARVPELAPGPLERPLDLAYRALAKTVDQVWGINLPRTTQLGRRVRIWHNGSILLHARSIGNDVQLRHDTTFGPVRGVEAPTPEALPVIEDGADIGSGACILGGITIGQGAVVGANSVVLKPVPPKASVLGVPARIIPS